MNFAHFLDIVDHEVDDLQLMLDTAISWKKAGPASHAETCKGLSLATIFEKSSTRTRISFNLAAQQLGMYLVELDAQTMHFTSGKESLQDTAKMLNGFVDALMYRTDKVEKFDALCEQLKIPLINALSDLSHPCQIMADLMTVIERQGALSDRIVLWVGDYNNVARSWCHAAQKFGFEMRLASPDAYAISDKETEGFIQKGTNIRRFTDPIAAAKDVNVINTDVWVSMGDTDYEDRTTALSPYQVNERIMAQAAENAIFLHCLPANRGQEVTDEVLDGPQSAAWQQAENRLHAQKAIIAWCLKRL